MRKHKFTYLTNKTKTHELGDENEMVNEIEMTDQLEE